MAMTKDQIKAAYPLPVYNFRVEIDGQAIGFGRSCLVALLYLVVMVVIGIVASIVLGVVIGLLGVGVAGMAG